MGRRSFVFEPDSIYHIYNRGYNKQQLFFEERDYDRFLENLDIYKEKYKRIHVYSYCVLPNHFHFLIQEKGCEEPLQEKSTEISNFMRDIQLSYAIFFNYKYAEKVKNGLKMPVFEGRFQARVVLDDTYLAHLKNYVEYNPVKHGLVDDPRKWSYSSYEHSSHFFVPSDDFHSDFL